MIVSPRDTTPNLHICNLYFCVDRCKHDEVQGGRDHAVKESYNDLTIFRPDQKSRIGHSFDYRSHQSHGKNVGSASEALKSHILPSHRPNFGDGSAV